jgi:hypothetical protein
LEHLSEKASNKHRLFQRNCKWKFHSENVLTIKVNLLIHPDEDGCLLIALMMEAASTSEMLITFYQITWHYNPEHSHLHSCHHENLKFYLITHYLKKP